MATQTISIYKSYEALQDAKRHLLFDDADEMQAVQLRDALLYILYKMKLSALLMLRDNMLHGEHSERFVVFCFEHLHALYVDSANKELLYFTSSNGTSTLPCAVIQRYIKRHYPTFKITPYRLLKGDRRMKDFPEWMFVIWFIVVLSYTQQTAMAAVDLLDKEVEDVEFMERLHLICCNILADRLKDHRTMCPRTPCLTTSQKTTMADVQITQLCKSYMHTCYLQLLESEQERNENVYGVLKDDSQLASMKKHIKLSWKMSLDHIQRSSNSLDYTLRIKNYNPQVFNDSVNFIEYSVQAHYKYALHVLDNLLAENCITTDAKHAVTEIRQETLHALKNIDALTSLMRDILYLAYSDLDIVTPKPSPHNHA